MKQILIAAAALSLLAPTIAMAQPGDRGHNQPQAHAGWGQDYGGGHSFRNGEHIGYNDWAGAQPVDYRQHHLRRPPHGYEWRQSNGQYILAAVATGVIISAIVGR
jgi:Ni/Co efflux regulator RcnB